MAISKATFRAGNYGAGSVMLWDRGTFDLIGDLPALEQSPAAISSSACTAKSSMAILPSS